MFNKIKLGISYMKKWPLEPLLNPVFPENRAKRAVEWACRILPPFIVFIVFWAIYQGGGFKGVPLLFALGSNFPIVIVCVVFLLSLPLQGYYWFYKRSVTRLNKKQELFYQNLCKKLDRPHKAEPTMQDLEDVITDGLARLDKEFLKEL